MDSDAVALDVVWDSRLSCLAFFYLYNAKLIELVLLCNSWD